MLRQLARVLGLADVDNTGEVMKAWLDTGTRISTYQAGDLAGLRVLYGAQPAVAIPEPATVFERMS